MLGPITADPEIGGVPGPVEALPDRVVMPPLGDRIAQKEQVDVSLLGLCKELLVHLHPRPLAWDRLDGGRGRGRGLNQERRARADQAAATNKRGGQQPERILFPFPHVWYLMNRESS
jgi:hypothetical protein